VGGARNGGRHSREGWNPGVYARLVFQQAAKVWSEKPFSRQFRLSGDRNPLGFGTEKGFSVQRLTVRGMVYTITSYNRQEVPDEI